MEINSIIQPGMSLENEFLVEENHLARHVGSGASRVLATPWMIAFMERVSHQLIATKLPEGYSSVGIHVDIRHLAPTPLGSKVTIRSVVRNIDGLKIDLDVEAWDEHEQIGRGTHQRYVIHTERFLRRLENKKSTA